MRNNKHELLPIVIQGNNVLVDALLLHRKLKSSGRFRDWIYYRIKEYGFKEDEDYAAKKIRTSSGQEQTNYLLTLDMAKELAMLERNEIGRKIRRYFIEKEKELRAVTHLPREQQLFKGLKAESINGRRLYPYKEMLRRMEYSTKGSSSTRKNRYPGHFVLKGHTLFITEEFTLHLYHQKQVTNNRAAIKAMQPVLPFSFGKGGIL